MSDQDRDHIPILRGVELQRITSRRMMMPMPASDNYEESSFMHSGPLHGYKSAQLMNSQSTGNAVVENSSQLMQKVQSRKHQAIVLEENGASNLYNSGQLGMSGNLLKSGPLGRCSNPNCIDCPSAYTANGHNDRGSTFLDSKLYGYLSGEVDGWAKKLSAYFPVMNPHARVVQQWNQFFVIACLIAIFIDPLFFFIFSVEQDNKCIIFDWTFAAALAVVRSATDFIYLLHMLLQYRLAYVAPETRVVGAGDLVDDPKKIALHYLRGKFFFDFFVVLPLPQVMILAVIPKFIGLSAANYAKNLLRITVLLQYVPRIIRFVPLLGGQSSNAFIFESAWTTFVINLLMFVLAGHVVGSCWYLFGLQRVNQCLRDACSANFSPSSCSTLTDCGRGKEFRTSSEENRIYNQQWLNQSISTDCFTSSGGHFSYGIYAQSVLLSTEKSAITRYIYSLFWGFQQISTLAGNLVPSYFEWEVLFTMGIIGLGLLLFALLIGNMQNFLQSLGRRKLEMQLRRRDVERWMSRRRLPEDLRRKIRHAERFWWAATCGVNEEELLTNLPEDIQREIRHYFFSFLDKIRIFSMMEEPILHAICERLRQNFYITGSNIFYQGGLLDKMIFIVRGKLESIGADGSIAHLKEGDVCGEELLTWYLEHTSVNRGEKVKFPGIYFFATRTVRCLSNVEAFALRATDIEEVTKLFSRFLRNPRVQGAIRYESPYWRNLAATHIQVAWRYWKRRMRRSSTSIGGSSGITGSLSSQRTI